MGNVLCSKCDVLEENDVSFNSFDNTQLNVHLDDIVNIKTSSENLSIKLCPKENADDFIVISYPYPTSENCENYNIVIKEEKFKNLLSYNNELTDDNNNTHKNTLISKIYNLKLPYYNLTYDNLYNENVELVSEINNNNYPNNEKRIKTLSKTVSDESESKYTTNGIYIVKVSRIKRSVQISITTYKDFKKKNKLPNDDLNIENILLNAKKMNNPIYKVNSQDIFRINENYECDDMNDKFYFKDFSNYNIKTTNLKGKNPGKKNKIITNNTKRKTKKCKKDNITKKYINNNPLKMDDKLISNSTKPPFDEFTNDSSIKTNEVRKKKDDNMSP